jgi:mono/diheme cytochrome c family protein
MVGRFLNNTFRINLCLASIVFFGLTLLAICAESWAVEQDATAEKQVEVQQQLPADPDKDREPSLAWGAELYGHYCTPCHGIRGDGNGFNAHKLIVKPANHTDAKFMSERNDQKLFDTINLGGVEVAKSTLMPPWGAALNNDNKIKSLVLKLRDLCKCKATKNW